MKAKRAAHRRKIDRKNVEKHYAIRNKVLRKHKKGFIRIKDTLDNHLRDAIGLNKKVSLINQDIRNNVLDAHK